MNTTTIGTIITTLRKEKGYTQEDLADLLGVTSGAVSKWETGAAQPDISLLKPLAYSLHTTVDHLLSFGELGESQINKIYKEVQTAYIKEGFSKGYEMSQTYLKQYPNHSHLTLLLASLLQTYCALDKNATEESAEGYLKQALTLFYKVVEQRDPNDTNIALFSIASLELGFDRFEKSQEALEKISASYIDPYVLWPQLFLKQKKYDEAERASKYKLYSSVNDVASNLNTLGKIAMDKEDFDRATAFLETANKIESIFGPNLDLSTYSLTKLYLKMGEKEKAAKWYYEYVKNMVELDLTLEENMFFQGLKPNVKEDEYVIIKKRQLEETLKDNSFKELSGISDYEKATSLLKENV